MAETPDYNYSQLAFANRKPSKFLGKRMSTHGPVTQMALAAVTIAPYERPPVELVRQRLHLDRDVTNEHAQQGAALFNKGQYEQAAAAFAKIPDSAYMLKAHAYLALAGLLETQLREEQAYIAQARDVLDQALGTHPNDVRAQDLARMLSHYVQALYLIDHAAEYDLSFVRAETGCLLNWVGPHDPLYSKKLAHYGRAFASMDPHRWTPSWHIAEEAFLELEQREPGNRFSGYYLFKDLRAWDLKDYQSDVGDAPQWAVLMREAFNRLLDQIEWWGQHRQLPDGSLGGGWGDDVEIGLVWELITLLNPDASPQALETVRALAEGVWWGGEVDRDAGFFDGLADVEHTGEWTGDSQAVMIGLDYGNPAYYERALKTAKLMRDLWTGVNAQGHRHFKSMVLGNRATGTRYGAVHDAEIDHPLNMRAAWPAFWAWWYAPGDELERLFMEWAEAWLAHTNQATNGKPAGLIPGPIGFHTDVLGGNQATDWRRGAPKTNGYENPTYCQYILDLFAQAYRRTGETRWLAPRMAQISQDGKEINLESGPTVKDTVADFEIEDWHQLLVKELDLPDKLRRIREAWPSLTSEVASTDRIAPPGLHELLHALLGPNFQGGLNSAPFTLEKTSRNVAFLCLSSGAERAKSLFYNFNPTTERAHVRLWRLQVGAQYRVQVAEDRNSDGVPEKTLSGFDYHHRHRGDAIIFELPSCTAVLLTVERTARAKRVPERVVDLGLGPQDIRYEDGTLHVTVHNIGTLDSGPFTVTVSHADKTLATFEIEGLEAPHDLEPRTVTRSLAWSLPSDASLALPTQITVTLDPQDRIYEITERNNKATQGFPHEIPSYRIPRAWPSLARERAQDGYEPYQPIPGQGTRQEPVRAQSNHSIDIIEGWRVASVEDQAPAAVDFDDSAWTVGRVPHSTGGLVAHAHARKRTPLWYRNRFQLSALTQDQRVFLDLRAACDAQAWVNGQELTSASPNPYHQWLDVTDLVQEGQNHLALRCIAPGIQGGVRIHVAGPQRLTTDNFLIDTPDWQGGPARVRARTEVVNDSDRPFDGRLEVSIHGPDGDSLVTTSARVRLAAGQSKPVTLDTDPVRDPPLWDIGKPRMCTARVTLKQEQQILHAEQTRFGFRWSRFDAQKGFFLNGRRVQLRGVVFSTGPKTHESRSTEFAYEISLLQDMGVNFVRVNDGIDRGLIQACDRAGILCAAPVHAPSKQETLAQTVTADVYELGNRPSIIAWHFNGEGKGVNTARSFGQAARTLRQLDTTRAVLCVELGWRSSGTVGLIDMDVAGMGNYTGWYEGTLDHIGPYMDDYRQRLRERYGHDVPMLLSNYGAAAESDTHTDHPRRNDYSHEYHTAFHRRFVQEMARRPWIAGGTLFCWRDMETLQPIPHHTWKGVLDGQEGRRDAFQFYRSQWTEAPMVHIAQHSWSPRPVWPPDRDTRFEVFSNCATVELFHNDTSLGTRSAEDGFSWMVRLEADANRLRALGKRGDVLAEHRVAVEVNLTPPAPELRLSRSRAHADKLELTWDLIPAVKEYIVEAEGTTQVANPPRHIFAVVEGTRLLFNSPPQPTRYTVRAVTPTTQGPCSERVAWAEGLLRWRFVNEGWLLAAPALGDLDRNGRLEIVVGSYSGEVFALDADGTLIWSYRTQEPGETVHSAPVVTSLQPGHEACVIFTSSRALYVLSAQGKLIWRQAGLPLVDRNLCAPAVGNLDGGSDLEIVVASDDGRIQAFRHTGKRLWSFSTDEGENRGLVHGTPVLFRESPGDDLNVLVGADSGRYTCLGARGKLRWRTARRLTGYLPGPVPGVDAAVGALEPGGPLRLILCGGHNGIYDTQGRRLQGLPGLGGTPHIADLWGDGRRQILSVRGKGLNLMDAQGTVLQQIQLADANDFYSHHLSCADVDGDGVSDIMIGTRATRLRVYDASADELWHYTSRDELKAPALVADLDADGQLEIVVCSRDGYLRVLGGGPDTGPRSRCLSFRGNDRRTGCSVPTPALDSPLNWTGFVQDLYALEHLPRLDTLPTRFVSSWDRTGANNDGHDEARVQGDIYTVADLQGPGVVRRLSAARPNGQLRIFLDGAATAFIDIPVRAFFSGNTAPFLKPVAGNFGPGYYSYFPIPFKHSLRIEIQRLSDKQDAFGSYYHVTYHPLPKDMPLRSLTLPLSRPQQAALDTALQHWRDLGRDPKPRHAAEQTAQASQVIAPGQRIELASLQGPAVIDALHLSLDSKDPHVLRSSLLQIHWDGQEAPAVDCPVGDFFGNGFSQIPFQTLTLGLVENEYYCYLPMPFQRRADMYLVNDSPSQPVRVTLRLRHHPLDSLDGSTGYFHAKWRREQVEAVNLHQSNLSGLDNYRVLDLHGRGRYIGMTLNVFNRNLFWWGEGDPMIFVDNDTWPPTWHGTGTEEHFNDAWGFHDGVPSGQEDPALQKANAMPVAAVLLDGIEPQHYYGPCAVFGLHLSDAIDFSERLRVTVEHGTENNLSNDYASTAYWYAGPDTRDTIVMPEYTDRLTLPQDQWLAARDRAVAEYLPVLRRQLETEAAQIPSAPTNFELFRRRIWVIRRVSKNAAALGIPKTTVTQLNQRMNKARRGPLHERWAVMDLILTRLAAALPETAAGDRSHTSARRSMP